MNREDWFKSLIQEFRVRYNGLTKDEKKNIPNLDDLTKPCQILSITFDDPSLTKTFILHLPKVKDGKIWEYGPIKPYEAFELFEKIIANRVWNAPVGTDEKYMHIEETEERTYRTLLDSRLMGILMEIQGLMFDPPSSHEGIGGKMFFLKRGAVWTYYGDLTKEDPAGIANNIIQETKTAAKDKQKKTKKPAKTKSTNTGESTRVEYPWYGTFLFPPVQIGKAPRIPFSKRLLGMPQMFELGTLVFEGKFDDKKLIATHNGFIGVESEESTSLELLNLLAFALLIKGKTSYIIREHELGNFRFDSASKEFGSWTMPRTVRLSILNERRGRDSFPYWDKLKLTKKELKTAISEAELYWKDEQLRFYMPFLLESNTHFSEYEYSQSFFMSWIIIETYLTRTWKDHLNKKKIPRNRLKTLGDRWTIATIIEVMELQGLLSDQEYGTLVKLKNMRNDILHGESEATKEDAKEALFLANGLLLKKVIDIHYPA